MCAELTDAGVDRRLVEVGVVDDRRVEGLGRIAEVRDQCRLSTDHQRIIIGPNAEMPESSPRTLPMTTPCIITVAITGSLPRKKDNPAVPISAAEQVESTQQAFEAGGRH